MHHALIQDAIRFDRICVECSFYHCCRWWLIAACALFCDFKQQCSNVNARLFWLCLLTILNLMGFDVVVENCLYDSHVLSHSVCSLMNAECTHLRFDALIELLLPVGSQGATGHDLHGLTADWCPDLCWFVALEFAVETGYSYLLKDLLYLMSSSSMHCDGSLIESTKWTYIEYCPVSNAHLHRCLLESHASTPTIQRIWGHVYVANIAAASACTMIWKGYTGCRSLTVVGSWTR